MTVNDVSVNLLRSVVRLQEHENGKRLTTTTHLFVRLLLHLHLPTQRETDRDHGCQMAIARCLDRMCLALRASGLWLRYATLPNLIPSFPWIAPPRPPPWRNPRKGRDQILPSGNLGYNQCLARSSSPRRHFEKLMIRWQRVLRSLSSSFSFFPRTTHTPDHF